MRSAVTIHATSKYKLKKRENNKLTAQLRVNDLKFKQFMKNEKVLISKVAAISASNEKPIEFKT